MSFCAPHLVFAPRLSILIAVTSNFLLAAMMTADKMVMEKFECFIPIPKAVERIIDCNLGAVNPEAILLSKPAETG